MATVDVGKCRMFICHLRKRLVLYASILLGAVRHGSCDTCIRTPESSGLRKVVPKVIELNGGPSGYYVFIVLSIYVSFVPSFVPFQ